MDCIVRRTILTTRQLVDRHSAPEAGYVPGGSPSESPELCYGMWSRCAFPAMFDDVTPSDVKAAFRLWFRELGRPLPDVLYAAPMFGDSEGSPSDESTESVESSDELSSSDVESDAGSESAESSSSDSFHPIEAAACHAPHVPSYAFPSSSRAFFDAESGSDSDSDWHPYEDDDQTRLLLGSVHLSEPSVPPPSPSSASIGDLSSYSSSWNDHDRGLDVSNASGKAVCDQEEDDIVAARGLYYADSTTSCADFVFDGDDLIFDASKDDFYTLFTPSDDELPPPTTAVASRLDEVDRPTLPSSSRELASEFLGTGPRETEGKDLDPTVAKAKPAVGDEVAAAPDLQESLPSLAISGVTPEEMCSAEDGTKEHERVVAQLASTSQTGVEVTQASTSATMIRGTKRKREAEEASDDVDDMAGPSTKVSFCGPALPCIP